MPTHLFRLGAMTPQHVYEGGTRADATVNQLPTLKGMALSILTLNPKGVREPHWHPNANELSYCIEGKGLMTIFSPGGSHDTFTVQAGEIVFVPQGYLHHIENVGDTPLKMAISFNHESPEDLNISSSVWVMPPGILAGTFQEASSFFSNLKKGKEPIFIAERENAAKPAMPYIPNRYKLNLEDINAQIQTKGGWVKLSNNGLLPVLDGLAVYSLLLVPKGAREPHWHPNASELNYLLSGRARITLLSPSGAVETIDMQPGDLSFMPQGYFHHIENIGTEDVRFAVFFSNRNPSDIGISGSLGAYSNDVLAAVFGVPTSYFESLPKFQEDLFVICGAG